MTGHLVLSTLHTHDAPSAVSRLIDMGVEPFLITSSLTLVVGQRLARVPCSRCSEPVEADPKTLELLGLDPEQVDGAGLRSGPGCGSAPRPATRAASACSRWSGDQEDPRAGRGQGDRGRPQGGGGGRRPAQHAGRRPHQGPWRPHHPWRRSSGSPHPDPDLARRATRRAGGQAPAQVPSAIKTPPKVLVLDDDRAIAEVAAAVLVDGYEVVAASHPDEGLRMVQSERPDLVLVDLDLPGVDPLQLLTRLHEAAVRPLPVLVMSATDDRHTRDQAANAGPPASSPSPSANPSSAARSPPSSSAARSSPDGPPG